MDEQNGKRGSYEAIKMNEQKDAAGAGDQEETSSLQINIHDNIEEPFDEEFWEKVNQVILRFIPTNMPKTFIELAFSFDVICRIIDSPF